jgi:putative endonuclease
MWYLYIVECSDGNFYTGITTDISNRIAAHNSGKGAKYTSGRCPVRLVYSAEFPDKSMASKEEFRVKKLSRAEKKNLLSTQSYMQN